MTEVTAASGMKINDHQHPIKFYAWDEKGNSAYSGGFSCNICRVTYNKNIQNFHCTLCQYDICDKCLFNQIDMEIKKLK